MSVVDARVHQSHQNAAAVQIHVRLPADPQHPAGLQRLFVHQAIYVGDGRKTIFLYHFTAHRGKLLIDHRLE